MQLFETCLIQHVYRECNFVVDALAKTSITLARGTIIFSSPPPHVSWLVFDDKHRTLPLNKKIKIKPHCFQKNDDIDNNKKHQPFHN
jgi:hypothetical protein